MVPKGWTLGTLNDLADTIMGYAFRSEDFVPTGIPLLRMGNLYQNSLDLNRNPVYLPDSFKVDYKRFLVKPGDLVMSMTGTMGKRDYGFTVEIPSNTQYSLLNQRVLKIVPKNNSSSGYILNLLRSELILSVLYSFPGGTKQANLSAKQVQELPVFIPPLAEQKKIGEILSIWDKAISVTENLLTNSQQQKKALMQQLLTGNKRLLDENGVRFNGKWEKKHLSDVADVYQPKTISQSMMSDSGYPVYGANGVIGFYQEFNHETEQIAVTCRGSTCGIVNWTQAKSWITGNAMVINTDNYSYVSKKFLFYTLNGSDLKYLISGSGQPQITGNIKTHIINLPFIEEQQKIATVLSAADAEISTLEKKIACLKDEKKALMQQLLTGKRRVKVDEAVAA
ncbi:restriction endonuclease subunit S [Citrobacter portucalensis]|uniref:restriction endonuclease subunit S n=1 Tax=Citrobacter portucalensis TaxID=1639133 RepID=UPI003D7CF8F9